jgi:hypothetical protein
MKTNLRIVSNIRKYTGNKWLSQGFCKHKISEDAEEWKTLFKSCYKNGERIACKEYKQVKNVMIILEILKKSNIDILRLATN